jgi:peptidoglycan hydrolase-like protein with peptidoglycan-binding domain
MTNTHRDLAAPELWTRSLERSRRRRALLPKARRELGRRKHMSAALATAMVAGPGAPLAAAQVSGAGVSAAVAAESPANRAIEVREGGLPLQLGSQGELVAHVQQALRITADGVFGPQTDAAVRSYQRSAGLEVDGIVGLATWGALFKSHTAGGASIGGSNIPPQVRERVEQTVQQAGQELAGQGGSGLGTAGAGTGTPGTTVGGTNTSDTTTSTPAPPPSGQACGSSTISSPVHGTVTSPFGPRGGRNHDGIDIAAPTGTPVRAAACGTVSLAGQQSGYGNIVCITHTSQFSTCYAHLSRFGVTNGARVQQGQVIGYVGCTGSCTGPHLHFETRVGGQAQDPQPYLRGSSIPGMTASTSQQASASGSSTTGTSSAGTSTDGTTTTTANQATVIGATATTGEESLQQSTTTTGTAQSTQAVPTAAPTEATTAAAPAEAVPTAAPAEATPVAPAEATPVAPAEATPVAPVEATPVAPAEAVPTAAPAEATPTSAPAEAVPTAAPAETTPVAPTEATPVAPAEAAPATTVAAAPATDTTVTDPTGTGTVGDGTATGSTETGTTVTGGTETGASVPGAAPAAAAGDVAAAGSADAAPDGAVDASAIAAAQ